MTEKLLIDEQTADITANYTYIRERISDAAKKSGRKAEDIRFMAVTKTVNPVLINHALSLGIELIGENKVQELLSKKEFLKPEGIEKHLIGHLQSNKVKKILGEVSMIESVDSNSLAEEISKHSVNIGSVTDVLLEVNIANEQAKTGYLREDIDKAVEYTRGLPGLRVRGLMSVPPVCENPDEARKYFEQVKNLFERLKYDGWNTLSLGMSADYYEAILSGSTLIRVGSALFGHRRY